MRIFKTLLILCLFIFSNCSELDINSNKINSFNEFKNFVWIFEINNKKYKLLAVNYNDYTIFGDKENRFVIFDGWKITEISGFDEKNTNIKLSETEKNKFEIFQDNKIKNAFKCEKWVKSTSKDSINWSQNCVSKNNSFNTISLDMDGKIIRIIQTLTHNDKKWVLYPQYRMSILNIDTIFKNSLLGFTLSLLLSFFIFFTFNFHGKLTGDNYIGPQKIHEASTPRVGGVIFLICTFFHVFLTSSYDYLSERFLLIIVAILPVFCSGIAEDISKSIKPIWRLAASFLTAFLLIELLNIQIINTDIALIDQLLGYYPFTLIFTMLSIVAMTQASNIIDGLNGLSIMTTIFILCVIIFLTHKFNDLNLLYMSLALLSCLLGVLILNFPFGKIFIGDGGAYFIGSLIAVFVIILPHNNDEISPFTSLLIILYPIYETFRSFLRRLLSREGNSMRPDLKHLHSKIYKYLYYKYEMKKIKANYLSSIIVMIFPALCCIWAMIFYNQVKFLVIGCVFFILIFEICNSIIDSLEFSKKM